jgi:hypothetical protein
VVGLQRPAEEAARGINAAGLFRSCRPPSCTPGGAQQLVWPTQEPGKAIGALKRRRALGVAEFRGRAREACGRGMRRGDGSVVPVGRSQANDPVPI